MAEIPPCCLAADHLGAARLLLVAMYQLTPHGADSPTVWARQGTLAGMLGADERTVRRHLTRLRESGFIRQVDAGWELAIRSDGTRQDWAQQSPKPDIVDRKPDSIDQKSGQYCPSNRSILSAPTLEEHDLNMINRGGDKSPSPPQQFELVPSEPEPDRVAELWAYQDELRVWAFAQRGRDGRRKPRPLKLDAAARRAVQAVLRDYSVEEARSAMRTCARDAASSDRSLSYFDGVSNWRRDNFRRFAAVDSDLLSERRRTTVRNEAVGPLLPECGRPDEICQRDDEDLRTRGSSLLREVVG